jgi:hypothetical protein
MTSDEQSEIVSRLSKMPIWSLPKNDDVDRGILVQPKVPEWLTESICSDKTLDEKREDIETAIEVDWHFAVWSLLAMCFLEIVLDKVCLEGTYHDGLGFSAWNGKEFREIAESVFWTGRLSFGDEVFCQRGPWGGPPRLAKHWEQLIALVALTSGHPDKVPPRIAKKLGLERTLRKRRAVYSVF